MKTRVFSMIKLNKKSIIFSLKNALFYSHFYIKKQNIFLQDKNTYYFIINLFISYLHILRKH